MQHKRLLFGLCLVLASLIVTGCTRCTRSKAIAVLESEQGDVRRAEAAHAGAWKSVAVGAAFSLGDALRTAHAAEALLGLDDGSKLRVRQDTTIRFSSRRPSKNNQAFDVETGQVLLEAGDQGLTLMTSIGLARIEANSQVLIRHSGDGVHFDVTIGKARFESSDGMHEVEAGQTYYISVGKAIVESKPGDAGLAPNTGTAKVEATLPETHAIEGEIPARVTGNGVSQKLSGEKSFQHVPPGSTPLRAGATVRIEAGSSVELEQRGAHVSLTGPSSAVVGAHDTPVELQGGNLSVSGALRIVVPGGAIETTSNSIAALETLGKNRTRVHVAKGSATVVGAKGTTQVSAGEVATLSGDGSTKLAGRGLDYADITANAGESFVVHDPRPPTAIRLQFASRCPAGGVIRVRSGAGGQFAGGDNSASLGFGPGRHDYALHCLGEHGQIDSPVARGTLTILKDAGTRPVPTTPPSTTVNIDGRDYTVMYQNQLPRVTVVWPNAPSASGYSLHIESHRGTTTKATASPSYAFASGALPEGRHTVYFEGGGKVSRHTGVEITFDNAAPTASLTTPVDTEVSPGGNVTIAGVAQPGWTVEIGGVPVAQDDKQRFNQGIQMPTTERALAVKLVHPSRGTHIYVRRATEKP